MSGANIALYCLNYWFERCIAIIDLFPIRTIAGELSHVPLVDQRNVVVAEPAFGLSMRHTVAPHIMVTALMDAAKFRLHFLSLCDQRVAHP
jgi:hypothetical protein